MDSLFVLFVAVALLAGVGFAVLLLARSWQLERLSGGGQLFRLVLPVEFEAGATEQLLLALHGVLRSAWRRLLLGQPWFSIELEGKPAGIELRFWIPESVEATFLARHVEAAFPGARLEPV